MLVSLSKDLFILVPLGKDLFVLAPPSKEGSFSSGDIYCEDKEH
jgi:hypothetical protein